MIKRLFYFVLRQHFMEFLAVISPRCFGEGWRNSAVGSLAFNLKYDIEGGCYHSGCYWGVLTMFKEVLIQCHLFSFQRPLLVLVDRNIDLATPLHHTWTYQALVHDVLVRINLILLLKLFLHSVFYKIPYSLLIQNLFCLFYVKLV